MHACWLAFILTYFHNYTIDVMISFWPDIRQPYPEAEHGYEVGYVKGVSGYGCSSKPFALDSISTMTADTGGRLEVG